MRAAAPRRSLGAAVALAIVVCVISWHGPRALHFVFYNRPFSAPHPQAPKPMQAESQAELPDEEYEEQESGFRDAVAEAAPQTGLAALPPPAAIAAGNSWWMLNRLPSGKPQVTRVVDTGSGAISRKPALANTLRAARAASQAAAPRPSHRFTPVLGGFAAAAAREMFPSKTANPSPLKPAAARSSAAQGDAWSRQQQASAGKAGGALQAGSAPKAAPLRARAPRRGGATARGRARGYRPRPKALSRLLGKGALRPPEGVFRPPDFKDFEQRLPLPGAPASLAEIEATSPPRRDASGKVKLASGSWAWLKPGDSRQWLKASAQAPILLRHDGHWWWRRGGVWFLIHDGEPWGLRYFDDWKREGLIHPASNTRILYSADGTKAAVVTPGQGAALFDVKQGRQLASWTEDQLPRRKQPKLPSAASIFSAN